MKWFATLIFLTFLGCGLAGCGRRLGGISSSYPAEDRDPWLTIQAGSAVPLIKAIRSYQAKHHKLPAEEKDLIPLIPPTSVPRNGPMNGWRYVLYDEECRLYLKLGWDPSLIYEQDALSSRWVFDPGDGSPEKEIILRPDCSASP